MQVSNNAQFTDLRINDEAGVFETAIEQQEIVIPDRKDKQVKDSSNKFDSFESAESLTDLFTDIAKGEFRTSKSLLSDKNIQTQVNTQPFYCMFGVLLLFLLFRIHFIKR